MASSWVPLMQRSEVAGVVPVRLGHDVVDVYLRFVWAWAWYSHPARCRVRLEGVLHGRGQGPGRGHDSGRVELHRDTTSTGPGDNVVRLEDGEAGLSAWTIRRRISSVSGLFEYLTAVEVVAKNPVPVWFWGIVRISGEVCR